MKITCSKSNLVKGVSIVSKAVPSKTTMPILECILIDATTDIIKLTANDMADIKKEISIPRGTKAIDVVRHIKGEIKIIDGVEVKLKDVPYEPVEHTDESLKRVNAKMWKTRTDRHNDYMLIFDEEFKPTERTDNVSEFLKEFPDSKVLELSFHGTGRIAGAYICRYGFADVRGTWNISRY